MHNTPLRTAALTLGLLGLLCMSGCKKEPQNFKDMTVEEAAAAHKAGTATFFDANTEDFRKENGKIAGAVLLAGREYDTAQVLPKEKDRPVVFYCTSRL